MLRSSCVLLAFACAFAPRLEAQPAPQQVPSLPIVVRQLADGFGFTEGAVYNPRGFYLFSDIPRNTLWKITPEGKTQVIRQPSRHSNGNTYDLEGRFVSCEHDRLVERKEKDGQFHPLATTYFDKKLNSPNDVTVWRDGSLFFTDPTYGIDASQSELGFRGLYRIFPDGRVLLLDARWQQPNGLCFSPDETRLYVNDSQAGLIYVYDVNARGELSNRRLFATIPKPGDPDGMRCDARGRLLVAAPKGVRIYEPSGELLGLIPVPQDPANLCLGGDQRDQLFITARTAVYLADLSKWEASLK